MLIDTCVICGLPVNSSLLVFWGVKVAQIFDCAGVSAPEPHVVQGSTEFQRDSSQVLEKDISVL